MADGYNKPPAPPLAPALANPKAERGGDYQLLVLIKFLTEGFIKDPNPDGVRLDTDGLIKEYKKGVSASSAT